MNDRKIVRVKDVMKSNFDMIDGKMTVRDALQTMKHVDTKSLIVDKRNDDDEYGMVLLSRYPIDAKHVCCISRCGQVFNTMDDGQTWSEWKLPDNVEDTYTVACI